MSESIVNNSADQTGDLWKQINALHEDHEQGRETLAAGNRRCNKAALAAGKLLVAEKAKTKHGKWEKVVAENFVGSIKTAQRYMQLYERHTILDRVDPNWQSTWSMREALEEIHELEIEESQATAGGGTKTGKNDRTGRTERSSTLKDPQIRKVLGRIEVGMEIIHSAIKSVHRRDLVSEIRSRAVRWRDALNVTIADCDLKYDEMPLVEEETKPKKASKSKAKPAKSRRGRQRKAK